MPWSKVILSTTMLVTAAALSFPSFAQPANPFVARPAAPSEVRQAARPIAPIAPSTLRPIAAGADMLYFSGEHAQRDVPFYVAAAETAQPARLVLNYRSAVSIMPETSRMQVMVNDLPAGETRLGRDGELVVDLPGGLLQPGYNSIRILVDQHHRVDCSIEGTYELWTQIDPSLSGLDFGMPDEPLTALTDFPAVGRTGTDRFAINLIQMTETPDEIDRLLASAQAAVLLGGIDRASVNFSGVRGSGPGLDIVIGIPTKARAASTSTIEGNLVPDVTLFPPDAGGRAALVIGAETTGDIDKTIEGLVKAAEAAVPVGTPSGLRALSTSRGERIATQKSIPLVDLGLDNREFAGRFYSSKINFELPPDFYAADYDAARIDLDAAYAAGLSGGAALVVRANGRQVTSLPLSSVNQGRIETQELKIPLSSFRPGRNSITFEATLLKASDETCEPAAVHDRDPRFVIGSASTIRLPRLARIGHLPDISALAGGLSVGGEGADPLTIYAKSFRSPSIDAAATILTKLAGTSGRVQPVKVTASLPNPSAGNLLAIGTYADLPTALLDRVGLDAPSQLGTGRPSLSEESPAGGSLISKAMADVKGASFADTFAKPIDITSRMEEIGSWATGVTSAHLPGLIGGGNSKAFTNGGRFTPAPDAKLVMAQAATPGRQPYAWTVLAAADGDALSAGVLTVTTAANWPKVGGAVTIVDADDQVVMHAASNERLYETQPRSFGNLRLVFAGWLSRHVEEYVVLLLLLALMLGISTRLLLSRVGNRDK